MYLVKCHIYNFGKFTDFDYYFNKGLNVINEENGWGKTTLSIFIKSIFYGLNKTKLKKLDENDRLAYEPFNGGKYGGYIDFCLKDGKTYRIERVFAKTASSDTAVLIDLSNGDRFTEEGEISFGEKIFGVNVDVFLRTLFLSQKDIDLSNNLSVANCIGNVYQNIQDDDIEIAIEKLNEKRLEYSGKDGILQKNREAFSKIDEELERIESASIGADEIEKDIDLINNRIKENSIKQEELKKLSNQVREVGAVIERKRQFDKISDTIKQKTNYINDINEVFANTPADEDYLEEVQQNYVNAVSYKNYSNILKEEISFKETERQNVLNKYKIKPSSSDLLSLKEKVNALSNASVDTNLTTTIDKKPSVKPAVFLSVACLVLAVLGIGLLNIINILGYVLLGVAGVLLIVTITLLTNIFTNKKSVFKENELIKLQNSVNVKNLETEILILKSKLGLELLSNEDAIITLSNDLDYFIKADNYLESKKADLLKHLGDYDKANLIVKDYVSKLNLDIFNLKNCLDYKELFKKLKGLFTEKSTILKDLSSLTSELDRLKNTGIVLDESLATVSKEEVDQKLSIINQEILNDTRLLSKRNEDLRACINAQEKALELNDAYDKALEDLNESKAQHDLIKKAIEYLKNARKSLTERYLEPVKKGVIKYLNAFAGKNGDDIVLDASYKISIANKSVDYESRGWKNVFSLALRFAFMDEVFLDSKEVPFIVLDDPFVNLDEDKIKLSLDAIKTVALDKQVIYFVCHNSRAN